MIYLDEIFDIADFDAMREQGYIRLQYHETEPLVIANYTEKAQFDRVWNDVTLNCRGLIFTRDTYRVVARPFPKFFNSDQPEAPGIGLDEAVHVTDKMDGSLGILYRKPSGGWAVATRGSFHSEQAEWATKFFNEKYAGYEAADHLTLLFEIVYPSNRIVCNYGDVEDLFLLGAVGIDSGKIYGPNEMPAGEWWPGPRTDVFECSTYADALAMPPREGKEGIVIRTRDGRMVKIKQDDYKRLHALISNLSSYSIWNNLMGGQTLEEIIESLPDETHDWARRVAAKIIDAKSRYVLQARFEFENINWAESRKEFAGLALKSRYRSALFNLYDDKSIEELAWKSAKPALITLGQSEDELYAVSSSE